MLLMGKMPADHRLMIAHTGHKLCLADSLGRENYSFLKQHGKHLTPEQLLFLPIDFGFSKISDTLQFFNLQQVQTEIRVAQTKK